MFYCRYTHCHTANVSSDYVIWISRENMKFSLVPFYDNDKPRVERVIIAREFALIIGQS